jgi:hypothetical protein
MAEEKFATDAKWRQQLLDSSDKVKRSLFENFGRLDKAQEAKKVQKALKAAAKACG